jgi:two-component system, cell cycle response regulator
MPRVATRPASTAPQGAATAQGCPSTALRQARRAWNLLHLDAPRCERLARSALAQAQVQNCLAAEAWARLALGQHALYFGGVAQARAQLRPALRCFRQVGDEAGAVLAQALAARALWREGRFSRALAVVLPLRESGLRVLRHDQRALLLNTIAGCYSAQGDSAQAFAYMYEALRDAGPRRGRGFDVVLHCNLAHELLQIGDTEEALRHVDQGLERYRGMDNPRLLNVLRINRAIALGDSGRAAQALPDVRAVLAHAPSADGRGAIPPHYESLAIPALRAGDLALGEALLARAQALAADDALLPDDRLERAIALALLALAERQPQRALKAMRPALALAEDGTREGQSLRVRAQFLDTLAQAHAAAGHTASALAALRRWQALQREQAQRASQARYQAAALHTELLRMQQRLDDTDAKRRATERAQTALVALNEELQGRVREVLALQEALRRQVTQDALTGLFNRRHLNDALPQLYALAQRDKQPLALVILDLDHFKRVNDEHGHAAGDFLLAAFGQLLAEHSRKSDVACRYGGEEFCLLMPRSDAATARRKAQALLKLWQAQRLRLPGGGLLSGQSFSAGAADTRAAPGSPDALLKAADDALLLAKHSGRARVLLA